MKFTYRKERKRGMEKDNKGKILGKLRDAKTDAHNSRTLKEWHIETIMEALIFIIRRL